MMLVAVMLLMSTGALAQQRRLERVHAMKVGFITSRLQLSASQAERFWPIYNRYESDLRATRRQHLKQRVAPRDMTDEQAKTQIENNLELQEAVIDLKKRYKNEFLKVISARQLMDLYDAEKDFRQELVKELRERKARNQRARNGLRR